MRGGVEAGGVGSQVRALPGLAQKGTACAACLAAANTRQCYLSVEMCSRAVQGTQVNLATETQRHWRSARCGAWISGEQHFRTPAR